MTKRSAGNANQKSISFIIPGALPSLNKLLRMHWAKRRKLKRDYMWNFVVTDRISRCGALGTLNISPAKKQKHIVSIIVYQPFRRFDEDNLIGATKILVDALRESGFIYRDSPKWLERKVTQEIDRKNPRVEITVGEA